MGAQWPRILLLLCAVCPAGAQIDSTRRELIQLGYDQPLVGQGPLAVYGYYYRNAPGFLQNSNLTLRLAVAPVYLDSELGVSRALGPHTDVGFGVAGGGFADSYSEVRKGEYLKKESFYGHGGEVAVAVYHLFNPDRLIPLYAVARGSTHYSAFSDTSDTATGFELPDDQFSYRVRAGLRWGGREPLLLPALAMELSAWYEGAFRTRPGTYGLDGDRTVESDSHLFWGRALLTYTSPKSRNSFAASLTLGTGRQLDRFTAYRLGGNLPLQAEFPLSLPGYYLQELSAESFGLLGASYSLALDHKKCWWVHVTASTAFLEYLGGLEQENLWNNGVGGGLIFRSPSDSWQLAVAYGYGIDANRADGYGGHSLTILLQFDLDRTRRRFFDLNADLNRSRGLQQFIRTIFR